MEVAIVSAREAGTGPATMAAQLPADVTKHSGKPALRYKAGDEWRDISYDEVGEAVREIALGLVDIGIEPHDRVAILSHTRPEWTLANFGILTAGATSVSIYQTNSPEECRYVLDHSGARAVFVEDGEQLAKIREVEADLPSLEHVIAMDRDVGLDTGDAIGLPDMRWRGARCDPGGRDRRLVSVIPNAPRDGV